MCDDLSLLVIASVRVEPQHWALIVGNVLYTGPHQGPNAASDENCFPLVTQWPWLFSQWRATKGTASSWVKLACDPIITITHYQPQIPAYYRFLLSQMISKSGWKMKMQTILAPNVGPLSANENLSLLNWWFQLGINVDRCWSLSTVTFFDPMC